MILLTGPSAPSGERTTCRSRCELVFRLASRVDAVLELPSGFRGATSTKAIPRDGVFFTASEPATGYVEEWRAPPPRWCKPHGKPSGHSGGGTLGKRVGEEPADGKATRQPHENGQCVDHVPLQNVVKQWHAPNVTSPGQAGRTPYRFGQIPKARDRGQASSKGTEAMADTWCSSGTRAP